MSELPVPPKSIQCRVEGHRWRPIQAWRVAGGFETEETCEECWSTRNTEMTNRGLVQRRRIQYQPGYLRTGQGRLGQAERGELRLTLFRWSFGSNVVAKETK